MSTTTAPDEAPTRTKAKVLADLRRTAKAIRQVEARRDDLYAVRAGLIHEGRRIDEVATQRELSEAAGVSETVIINALKKPDPGEAGDGTTEA